MNRDEAPPVDPRQLTLPAPGMRSDGRICYECGGDAEAFTAAELCEVGAMFRLIGGSLSYRDFVAIARRSGLTDSVCWTSLAGVSVCRTGKRAKPKAPKR